MGRFGNDFYVSDASSMISENGYAPGNFKYSSGSEKLNFDASGKTPSEVEQIKADFKKECRGYGVYRATFLKVAKNHELEVERTSLK
ncbi:MAG: hypothetical protein GY796_36525 [Chloroflexi bacterium]|nr:hypothetical protein [Chloroflexota bacterium]